MEFIISVDAGGTKTEAIAYNLDGIPLASEIENFGNILIDPVSAVSNICRAVDKVIKQLKHEKCVYMVLGIAGSQNNMHHNMMNSAFSSYNIPYTITNDAKLAHAAYFKGKSGILTISGTGSISVGMYLNNYYYTGGWGHLLGDEGSGYWISIEYLKLLINEWENKRYSTRLFEPVFNFYQIHDIIELKSIVYSETKKEIASLVPVIVKLADDGEKEARQILINAADYLVQLTVRCANLISFDNNIQFAIKGSVLMKIKTIRDRYLNGLKIIYPDSYIISKDISSTRGGYYIAIHNLIKK